MSAREALDGAWLQVFNRMAADIQGAGGAWVGEELPLPTAPGALVTPLEAYARAVPDASLRLSMPVALAAYCIAGQGAYWMKLPLKGGAKLDVPMIFQSTVIAPSGYGKSTVLNPLVRVLDKLNHRGIVARKKIGIELAADVIASLVEGAADLPAAGLDLGQEKERAKKIYGHAACKRLTLDSGTPEGVRSALIAGGSMAGIMTAEPDILREISGYAKDGGTYRYLLDGWGGDKISVVRAEKSMTIPRCVLPYCIVVQPIAFEQFNKSARGGEDQGVASDSAVGRGLYGRSWLMRIGWEGKVGEAFGLETGFEGAPIGKISDLAAAEMLFSDQMEALGQRADAYRARMGIEIGWEEAAYQDAEGLVPHPELPDPVLLGLASDAMVDYASVHNLRTALIDMVAEQELTVVGTERIYMPMVSRLVQHVMRIAMELQLSLDPGSEVVERWAVRDAGSRIVPWLFTEWAQEMRRYTEAATEALVETETKKNPRGLDLTYEGAVVRGVRKVLELKEKLGGAGGADEDEFPFKKGEVMERALGMYSSSSRAELRPKVNGAFDALVDKGWLEEHKVGGAGTGSKGGRPVITFRRTVVGKMNGL